MAYYIKGDAVPNATSYELAEKSGSDYKTLTTGSEIDFDLSALSFTEGSHTLVVKAKASGYTDSAWSNEVTYTVSADGGDSGDDSGDDDSGGSGGATTVNVFEPYTYNLAAGYRFDIKIPFGVTLSGDTTLTVLVTAENETYTGYPVLVYINADTSRAVKGTIGTPFTVDVLSTDTKLWFFTNGINGLETAETFTITATMEVNS